MPNDVLITLEAARARLLADGARLPKEDLALAEAAGLYLAADMTARLTQPPTDMSAMDGYALRFADLPGPFAVIGEAAAGTGFAGTMGKGEAVRIFTGAPVPAGADTVAVQEDAQLAEGRLTFPLAGPPAEGAHIRRGGVDFSAGMTLARAGDQLTPARIGLLAAGGHAHAPVHRRPLVTLLATGDELVPPGAMPGPGQIVSSNGAMLAALLRQAGARVCEPEIVPDRRQALAEAIAAACDADLLVTIGGASVGDHDLVQPVLRDMGAEIAFWRLAIRPGKPMMAGRLGGCQILGLPGNPAAAFVCATLFLLPLIRHRMGDLRPEPVAERARTMVALPANGQRRDFLRARLGRDDQGPTITPASAQDSSLLSVLAGADALLVREEFAPACSAGTEVPLLRL